MPTKRNHVTLADVAGSTGAGPAFQGGERRPGGIIDAITATEPATTVITAALRQVAPHPDNPRSQLGDLTEMAETIAAGGLIQPLVVMTAAAWRAANPDRAGDIDPNARWVILAGHRRRAAAELAGSHDVPVLVRDDLGAGSAANVTFLVENIHRQNLAPLDEATALSRLAGHQLSQREIARLTGISQAQVSKKLSLLTLPDAAKADMRRGDLTFTEALRVLELPDHLQAGVYEQGKQHGYTLDAAVRITTARLDTEAKAAAARQRLADEGTGVVGDPAEEFGSDQVHLHHLWDANDITAAKAADICVAHIDTHGRVEYYTTTPRPWPWQPPAPRTGGRVPPPRPDDPDTADTSDNAHPAEDLDSHDREDAARHDAIAAFIRGSDPEQSAEMLAKLTLLGWQDDEDQDLTARLLGTSRHPHWSAYRAELLHALTGTDQAVRIATALAVAFARAETWLDRRANHELNSERQLYLQLLADDVGHGAH